MQSRYDIAIIGGGPAGLACACLSAAQGLRVAVIEKESEATLAAPLPDGRDIALTHRSVKILEAIGAWAEFPRAEISPIARACVRNGPSDDLLRLEAQQRGQQVLGFLVGNNIIRAGLYRRTCALQGVELMAGMGVEDILLGQGGTARVMLAGGGGIEAPLVVAADSRFSQMRRKAGIGAEMRDFGRVCIVSRMRHEQEHDGTAYEWFDLDQTLAVLPLNGRLSSIVVTLPTDAAARTMAMSPQEFAADVERRFKGKWGRMELEGLRHPYPLVAVYAHRFHARRFALVGDAAVGMHPVTAHGFNFGLRGADRLIAEVARAARTGGDIGAESVLETYGREHRRATYPLYLATNTMVGLYTDSGPLARIAREGLLRLGNGISPVKGLLVDKLTEIDVGATGPTEWLPPLPSLGSLRGGG